MTWVRFYLFKWLWRSDLVISALHPQLRLVSSLIFFISLMTILWFSSCRSYKHFIRSVSYWGAVLSTVTLRLCQLDTYLDIPRQKGISAEELPLSDQPVHMIAGHFLDYWYGKALSSVDNVFPGRVGLNVLREIDEQAKASKPVSSIPTLSLYQILLPYFSLSFCLDSVMDNVVWKCKSNKYFLFQFVLDCGVYHSEGNTPRQKLYWRGY